MAVDASYNETNSGWRSRDKHHHSSSTYKDTYDRTRRVTRASARSITCEVMISILVEMEVMVAGRNECCFMRGMGEEGGGCTLLPLSKSSSSLISRGFCSEAMLPRCAAMDKTRLRMTHDNDAP